MTKNDGKRNRRELVTAAGTTATVLALGGASGVLAHEVSINAMGPTPEQMQAFLALPDRPIVMVNLLKFKPDGGAAAYARYGAAVRPLLAKVGAKLLFSGQAVACLIGKGDWDVVGLVEYPTPKALLEMSSSAEYQAIHHHRADGLVGQVNYAVVQTEVAPEA